MRKRDWGDVSLTNSECQVKSGGMWGRKEKKQEEGDTSRY